MMITPSGPLRHIPIAGPPSAPPAFREAIAFWMKLGWINFGGPAGQIAIMHRELVERRRWIDETAFVHGLNYCMLMPGPEAMQLATWLGWRLHGLRGGIAAGVLFVLPATVILAVLAWVYLRFGQVTAVSSALLGVQAAVLAIIAQALLRIGGRVLRTPLALVLALSALVAIALGLPFPLVIGGAAVIGLVATRIAPGWLLPPYHGAPSDAMTPHSAHCPSRTSAAMLAIALLAAWWLPLLGVRTWLGPDSTSWAMGAFFSKAALVTLGGAYAVLPYVAQQAVEVHGWLEPGQMLVGLGLAESTPGPLIMVLEFVGFVGGWQHPDLASPLASAVLGAAITVWATFLPSFLFVLPVAPWIERLRNMPALDAALAAVTAAVVGTIANLALWFGWRLLLAQPTRLLLFAIAVAVVAGIGMARWKWGVPAVVLTAAVAGAIGGAMGLLRPA